MNLRTQTIKSLKFCTDAESNRISNRLQQCNVRAKQANNQTKLINSIRTPQQAAHLLENDLSILAIEYMFNGIWTKL